MTTRAELRTSLRQRLEDTGLTPLWNDATLHELLAAALRDYAARRPAERTATVVVTEGDRSAAVVPTLDPTQIVRVLDPNSAVVTRVSGETSGETAVECQGWTWRNGSLRFAAPAMGGTWSIDYLDSRVLPADDVTAVDLVPGDESIVVVLAGAAALARRAVEEAKRGAGREGAAMQALAEALRREGERRLDDRRRRARGAWLV